ncbi:MAG TPA: penicillin-binding transpeptidase domain-containing protein [Candidatus Nanoarchaeia archaeon]|nr:penicillin-binding transpeptidase domain-containing protein [Candidatus Nanoarchaeia archaeon]
MIKRLIRKLRRRNMGEINPEEIFIDSSNLPEFDVHQFEGRLEQPISRNTIIIVSVVFVLVGVIYASRLWSLQVNRGEAFAARSEQNRLRHTDLFANRGAIFDRNGVELASNGLYEDESDFAKRVYAPIKGVSHLLGYVKYPTKDNAGFYYRTNYIGEDGVEKVYHDILSGKNGVRIVETDARGKVQSQGVIEKPVDGQSVTLSIDSRLNNEIYTIMEKTAADYGFNGGAAIMMDVTNGDLLAFVSYPEYDSSLVAEGDSEALKKYQTDPKTPFLNRAVSGLYTPGSIVKPIVALAALEENIISPDKKILSTGALTVPNPYFPDKPTIFRDWKAHGWVDMRKAIAVSSDVYFYTVGGGFEDQKGIGILNIEKYYRMFGLGERVGINISHEKDGVIPNPEWKEKNFDGDPWRVGDTYNTAIGQYGVQFTPVQVVRFVAALANEGTLITPHLVDGEKVATKQITLRKEDYGVVKEGMRMAVTDGTAAGLNVPYVEIAAKTGTAELGVSKSQVNSWSVGFFPYQNPKYAFVFLMERGPVSNTIGATYVARQTFDWMNQNTPEYFK